MHRRLMATGTKQGLIPFRLPLESQGGDVLVRGRGGLGPLEDAGQTTGKDVLASGISV